MSLVEATAVSIAIAVLACLLTGLVGVERDWPDYAHVDYGLPVPWRVHVTSTIAGPTDEIRYNIVGLVTDLAFWIIVMGSITMSLYLMSQSSPLRL